MDAFFKKYSDSDVMAIKMMSKKLNSAKKYMKAEKKDEQKAMKCLAELYSMLECYFQEKHIDPTTLTH